MNGEIELLSEVPATHTLAAPSSSAALAGIPRKTQDSLRRMFADPHLLEKEERTELVTGLRACVLANPEVSELRVLYGMALCVDFKVEDAIEELREGVRLAPNSFVAQLKMGELWMRLRVCEKAAEHTRQAALLAGNPLQSELARRQAAKIREFVHNGIQRGGPTAYSGPLRILGKIRNLWTREGKSKQPEDLATADAS